MAFGDTFAGIVGPALMYKMSQGQRGQQTLGALAGQREMPSLMRRLMEMAALAEMDRQPGPKNNWNLNQAANAFRGVPIQGGTGFRDYLGGFLGMQVPSAGGGTPGGMNAPGPEGDMYSEGMAQPQQPQPWEMGL